MPLPSVSLDLLSVILVRPKFSANVGAVARACCNMGVSRLALVDPLAYDPEKAASMATVHARHLSDAAPIHADLASALADQNAVYGTTARLGGWRQAVTTPDKAAQEIVDRLRQGQRVALVFGSEDKGLTNEETQACGRLLTIPTVGDLSSLNLAQAVMVVLYECAKAARGSREPRPAGPPQDHQPIGHAEQEVLFAAIQEALLAIDFFKDSNADYWMLPLRRFFAKLDLKRHEFNHLMGICRQIVWMAGRSKD